jgi:hypothetical protein
MAMPPATTFARTDDFPIGACSQLDVHAAPADPSASSATSAPSGFDFAFCFSPRLSACAVNILLCGVLILPAAAQDARDIVRRSVELDRNNWIERADYTWVGHSRERHFDAHDQVTSDRRETWETLILDGLPFTRVIARDDKPLPPAEQRKQQQKLDRETARLASETPEEKQKRAAGFEKSRRRERAFLLEIPDAFDLHLDGSDLIDGQDVWVVSGVPKPGYQAKTRDGAALSKIRGKMWIEKAGYQWVRVEAETIETISFGLFLARLSPGARLVLEQTRINSELWLPKRVYMAGKGRIALLKRIAEDDEITWTDYKKFSVDSHIVPREP